MEAASALSWLVTIVHVLLALAFGGLCLARMSRLGTGGAMLLLGVAVLDILITLGFRVFGLLSMSLPPAAFESSYTLLNVSSALVSVLSAVMVLIGLILIGRVKPEPS
jgi:hypothetical protein